MDCITETASSASLAWRPCACLHMCSIAISLKVHEKQVSFVFGRCKMFARLIIDSRELPCICLHASVIAGFNVFFGIDGLITLLWLAVR